MSLFQALSDDLSEEHITMIFNNLDTDNSQSIDLEEFMVSWLKYRLLIQMKRFFIQQIQYTMNCNEF